MAAVPIPGFLIAFWAAERYRDRFRSRGGWRGLRMNGTALIIGFTTGMLFTRRVGPLGGAGLLALILPLTIWSSGAPLAVAITGVFAYQALFFWLLMPIALACWPSSSVHREIYGGKSPSCLITG